MQSLVNKYNTKVSLDDVSCGYSKKYRTHPVNIRIPDNHLGQEQASALGAEIASILKVACTTELYPSHD